MRGGSIDWAQLELQNVAYSTMVIGGRHLVQGDKFILNNKMESLSPKAQLEVKKLIASREAKLYVLPVLPRTSNFSMITHS